VPFACGSATIYRILKKYLSLAIELIPVELARSDNRPNEPFYKKLDMAVDDIAKCISSYELNEGYAIFAHSMVVVC
jgi:surfactin synthase thioesterase subunit